MRGIRKWKDKNVRSWHFEIIGSSHLFPRRNRPFSLGERKRLWRFVCFGRRPEGEKGKVCAFTFYYLKVITGTEINKT